MSRIMITLNKIKEFNPCADGWEKVYQAKKFLGLDVEFPLSDIIESNSVQDAFWALRCVPDSHELLVEFANWCSDQVKHIRREGGALNSSEVEANKCCANACLSTETYKTYTSARKAAAWAEHRCDKTCKVKKSLPAKFKEILDTGELTNASSL